MSHSGRLLDLLIVGAGISGISAACHMVKHCPEKSFAIVEARDDIGGTWDLFRYPGIRSDSDMQTFGFAFKPWTDPKVLADGPSIKAYLRETVRQFALEDRIRFGLRVKVARWLERESRWQVTVVDAAGEEVQYRTRVLFMCSGYYNYEQGYTPPLPGLDSFNGTLVHPQHWPEDLDCTDREVAVIGSGATAVTLVPALAGKARRVTMIQRSPTWIVSRPAEDALARLLNRLLPERLAYRLIRWRNIHFQNFVYRRSRTRPQKMREQILKLTRKELGEDYPLEPDFTPRYDPWDQRLCLVPDADLFKAIKSGKARIVTGQIERITADGVQMQPAANESYGSGAADNSSESDGSRESAETNDSGREIKADILVTATGLELKLFGGVDFYLGDEKIDFASRYTYHGMMVSGVPNLVWTFGYINASWTLRADLNSRFVCDLFNHMDEIAASCFVAQPEPGQETMPASPWVTDFNPGYIQRGLDQFPRQGDHPPWRNTQDFLKDRKLLKDAVADSALHFS